MSSAIAFVGTGADSPWVLALYEAIASVVGTRVAAIQFAEFGTERRRPIVVATNKNVEHIAIRVPPAYATRLHWLTRRYLVRRISGIYSETVSELGTPTFFIVTHPAFERWSREIPDEHLVYWNFDDYRLYQPKRAAQIEEWEANLIVRARLVLCASRTQQSRLRNWWPEYAKKIYHFPNAVRREWIPNVPSVTVEAGTVGYVGNMGDRLDWQLVYDTARACRDFRFVFVGGVESSRERNGPKHPWAMARQRSLELPNVESKGVVPQGDVWRLYQSFDIGWIPYDVRHPFNIASCPTKIFDGLGSGRPLISTAVPECLLYPEHVSIVGSAEEASRLFRGRLRNWSREEASKQLDFARQNDWHTRAGWLLKKLKAN